MVQGSESKTILIIEHQQENMMIRRADVEQDFDQVWNIFSNVINSGDTYVFDPNTPKESLYKNWFAD